MEKHLNLGNLEAFDEGQPFHAEGSDSSLASVSWKLKRLAPPAEELDNHRRKEQQISRYKVRTPLGTAVYVA